MSFTAEKVGYPDWQRMVNWDGPVLWSIPATTAPPDILSPIFETARYAYLGGTFQYNSGAGNVTFTWFADSAGTVITGTRTFYLVAQVAQIAQLRIPNLGPWCQVRVQAQGLGNVNAQAIIAATNRSHPLELIPAISELVKVENSPLGAGGTAITTPLYMCSGPVKLWTFLSAANMTVQLFTADSSGTQQSTYEFTSTAGGDFRDNVVMPPGGYSFRVSNGTGVQQSYYLSVVSSGTGST